MVEDDDETLIESGGSTRATSVESDKGSTVIENPRPHEQAKIHGHLSAQTTEPVDRPTSPSAAPQIHMRFGRGIGGGRELYMNHIVVIPILEKLHILHQRSS